jgi:hypothetical protein
MNPLAGVLGQEAGIGHDELPFGVGDIAGIGLVSNHALYYNGAWTRVHNTRHHLGGVSDNSRPRNRGSRTIASTTQETNSSGMADDGVASSGRATDRRQVGPHRFGESIAGPPLNDAEAGNREGGRVRSRSGWLWSVGGPTSRTRVW